jgi:hypothetical protein
MNCNTCIYGRLHPVKKRGKEIGQWVCHVHPPVLVGEDEEGMPILERFKFTIDPLDPCCREYKPVMQ